MTATNTIQFFKLDEHLYNERCLDVYGHYIVETQTPLKKGAIVSFSFNTAAEAFENYHQLRNEGYKQSMVAPTVLNGNPMAGVLPSYTIYLEKSEAAQQADLETIYATIRAEMEAELEILNAEEQERQVQLLVEAEERKQLQKEQDRLDKLRAAKLKELQEAYAE